MFVCNLCDKQIYFWSFSQINKMNLDSAELYVISCLVLHNVISCLNFCILIFVKEHHSEYDIYFFKELAIHKSVLTLNHHYSGTCIWAHLYPLK